jgi:hypothetical protein
MPEWMQRLMKLEPAVWRGLIAAIIALLGSVGILVSPDIPDLILGVWNPLTLILSTLWIRPAVTPNAKVAVYMPDPEARPTVVRSGEADASAASDRLILAAAKQ